MRFTNLLGASLLAIALSACGGTTGSPTVIAPPVVVTPPPPPPIIERPATPEAAPAGPDFHPTGKGWQLAWSDEFDGTALDPQKWTPQIECWAEAMMKSNAIQNARIMLRS